jgi:predicted phosphoadenosine phosphosulfate sulfurtransferase
MVKQFLNKNVYEAAKERISFVFDYFEAISVSFSGGKDSTVMLQMVMDEAIKRNRKVALLFIDLEGQYKMTVEHVDRMFNEYKAYIEPYWIALPLSLRNAVSVFEPKWICWDKKQKEKWIRKPPSYAITDEDFFSFFSYGMEFEDFVPGFAQWYAKKDHYGDGEGRLTASFVGIRTDESLNRYTTISASRKTRFMNQGWTTWNGGPCYSVYPIYDWKTQDIWTYHNKTGRPYNRLYDRMYQAGLSIHQARICQPYGDDQRKGLWLFHVIEPETWGKVVARVNGANSGALYAKEKGNINGTIKVDKPDGHTWESFSKLLLGSMPEKTREHYKNKISVFLAWWKNRGYETIPDEADPDEENAKKVPSWRRIAKTLLRNDYWCKGLSFSQTKAEHYEKYMKVIKKKREKWNIQI